MPVSRIARLTLEPNRYLCLFALVDAQSPGIAILTSSSSD
jgi:hypothetical protein